MKKILLSTLLFAFAHTLNATVITVSNDPATVAQYSDIQSAIDNALDGDTLYIHGSAVIYPSIDIYDKKLCLIGPGYAPDIELPQTAKINGLELRNTPAGGDPSGSEFQGIVFTARVDLQEVCCANSGPSISDIKITRCKFIGNIFLGNNNRTLSVTNIIFENNYFNAIQITGSTNAYVTYGNIIFTNNIFRNSKLIGFLYVSDFLINHNLFYASGSAYSVFNTSNEEFLITNNIFYKANAEDVQNSTFKNNITYNSGNNSPWTANTNIDGGGNIANQNPQIESATEVNNGDDNPLLNFSIAAGPANNSGLDGKDMGLLFDATGPLNWTFTRNARLPRVTLMQIINPTIAPGDNLNVQLEAKVSR